MKRGFFIFFVLIVFLTITAVSADENITDLQTTKNPVEDIEVSYGDIYGDVLAKKDNTYDLCISNIPDKCEANEFKLSIDNRSVDYKLIEYSKDFNQLYGTYTYKYSNSNHTLNVDFIGNDHYKAYTKTFTFNVTSAIIYIPQTVTEGISYDRSVEVYLAEDTQGNLQIKADGKDFISQNINEAKTIFPLDSLGFGSHEIEVTFKNSIKAKRKINVTYYFAIDFYGDELITITLPWDVTKTPTIYIDGAKYAYSSDGITYTKPGTHTIKATYPGDGRYPAKTITKTFTVKGDPKIVAQKSKISMYYADSKTAKFTVYGLDSISVKLDGVKTTVKVKNNVAKFTIPTLKPGKYNIIAKGKNYLYAKTVLSVKHVVSLKKVAVKKSAKKLVLSATLTAGKTPLKSKKITFIFNGAKYTKKTNSKGIAKLTIKSGMLKKLKVKKKITYKAYYGKDLVSRSVKVQR